MGSKIYCSKNACSVSPVPLKNMEFGMQVLDALFYRRLSTLRMSPKKKKLIQDINKLHNERQQACNMGRIKPEVQPRVNSQPIQGRLKIQ